MSELMKRAAPGLAIAGVALSAVWLLDPALRADPQATAAEAIDEASPEATDDPGDAADPEATSGPEDGAESDDDAGSGAEAAPDSGSDPAASSTDCSDTTVETGDAAMTQWGPVQVQMEFAADGSVCAVTAIAYPMDDHHSARINTMAIPYLDSQATQVGVAFDSITGATYTSEAYRESMQSILDRR